MNLSIPDAAAVLGVSETRLRRTLAVGSFPIELEMRRTTTGVRQATMLPPQTIERLQLHFYPPLQDEQPTEQPLALPDAAPQQPLLTADAQIPQRQAPAPVEETPPVHPCLSSAAASGQNVPLSQFNSLLYQHNVLREELTRVTHYLDDCDRLLGEMVKTIAALEERTRTLEQPKHAIRPSSNPLSGALRSMSHGLQNALLSRAASAQPALAPAEVYYANVLARG